MMPMLMLPEIMMVMMVRIVLLIMMMMMIRKMGTGMGSCVLNSQQTR